MKAFTPAVRRDRLLEQMLAFFVQRATEQRMLGLYAEAVTVHPFSQKSNTALGATETAEQIKGFSLWVLRAVMSGRGDEVIDVAKTNLLSR